MPEGRIEQVGRERKEPRQEFREGDRLATSGAASAGRTLGGR